MSAGGCWCRGCNRQTTHLRACNASNCNNAKRTLRTQQSTLHYGFLGTTTMLLLTLLHRKQHTVTTAIHPSSDTAPLHTTALLQRATLVALLDVTSSTYHIQCNTHLSLSLVAVLLLKMRVPGNVGLNVFLIKIGMAASTAGSIVFGCMTCVSFNCAQRSTSEYHSTQQYSFRR
jgi:hypothetical protein